MFDPFARELAAPSAAGVRRSFEFSGTYRHISYEARATIRPAIKSERFHEPESIAWCHYIYLHERALPAEWVDRLFLAHDLHKFSEAGSEYVLYHYSNSPLASLDWHCGITYYDLVEHVPGHRVLKAGCDYQHLWDEGHRYSADDVVREAKATIDSLWDMVPGMLVRSLFDGSWAPPEPEPGIALTRDDKGGE